jgi:Lar family restriction alleviation protein
MSALRAGMHDEFLPCPFCGSLTVDYRHWAPEGPVHVECGDCGAQACEQPTEAEATERWNLRPKPLLCDLPGCGRESMGFVNGRLQERACSAEHARAISALKDQEKCRCGHPRARHSLRAGACLAVCDCESFQPTREEPETYHCQWHGPYEGVRGVEKACPACVASAQPAREEPPR